MDEQEIAAVYEKLNMLLAAGDEAGARSYLAEQFPNLPEKLQAEVAMLAFMDGIDAEVQERETIGTVQEDGVTALEQLEKKRAAAEKGNLQGLDR